MNKKISREIILSIIKNIRSSEACMPDRNVTYKKNPDNIYELPFGKFVLSSFAYACILEKRLNNYTLKITDWDIVKDSYIVVK